MSVKTTISETDLPKILADYDLGEYREFKTFANGAGQTTLLLETSTGKFVLRYYENRPQKHVSFEVKLFNYLRSKSFPVPAIVKNRSGESSGIYKEKPYIIIEFIEGEHGKNPNDFFNNEEAAEVVKVVVHLHNLTKDYNPEYFKDREVFDAKYCWREFEKKHSNLVENEKGKWFKAELEKLEFPTFLLKGLCHADLNYGNFLFKNGKIVAVLDFDMSFYTYLIYDIASLIYWWAWPPEMKVKEKEMALIVSEYSKQRELNKDERAYIYDALKLIILLGISWSEESDFEDSKSKIEFLNLVGREKFLLKLEIEGVYVKESTLQGKGVFAVKDFKKNDLVLEIDDTHVVEDENKLTPEQHAFDLDYLEDKIVLMQEPEKYINHSCNPNTYVKTKSGVRQVLAMRDISKGDEITYDYSINGDNEGTFECRCGSKNCRKIYQGNFFKLPIELQKHYLPYLDDWFSKKHEKEIQGIKDL